MRRLGLTIAFLAAASLGSCGSTTETANAAYDLSIVDCAGNATGVAAGIAIAPELIASVGHPFDAFQSFSVTSGDGVQRSATLVYLDLEKDLSLIRLSSPVQAYLPLGNPTPDAEVELATFEADNYAPEPGRILKTLTITLDGAGSRRGMELAAEIESGDSGAGVVADGEVVGIVFATSTSNPGRGWAVSATEVEQAKRLVEEGAIPPPEPSCQAS